MPTRFTPRPPRRVAIVGSRHITDYRKFCQTVRPLLRRDDVLVSGGADGVDSLAARYARQNGHQLVEYPIDLELVAAKVAEGVDRRTAYGIVATARNTTIVNDADVMIAIPCTHSRGTYDSIQKFRRKLRDLPIGEFVGKSGGSSGVIHIYEYLWSCPRE